MLPGKVIRWTFSDGPMPNSFEHVFHDDGRVTWRILDGDLRGASGDEKQYTAFRISDDVYSLSYLSASGHTLTVIFNVTDKRMFAYGSNEKEWIALHGSIDEIQ